MEKKMIFKKNMECLLKYNSILLNDINRLDFNHVQSILTQDTESGIKTAYINYNQRNYYLHSVVDPLSDAERIVKSIDFKKDSLIVVFGLGLGYHLFKLKEKISEDTRIIVIEHNMDVFKYSFANIDLTDILNSPQFLLVFGDRKMQDYQISVQAGYNFYNLSLNLQYIMLPNYYIYGEENILAMREIKNRINSLLISMGNSLQDMFNGFKNNYLNIESQIKSNSIKEIREKFKGRPAIVISAGPSLEKNIQHLKEAQGKAVIIACDASLKACEMHGIKPDAVASIERDEETYTYYYKDRDIDESIVLVGPGLLYPRIFQEYSGKTIIMSKFPKTEGVEGWWYSNFDNVEFVNQGMSCANVAFSVAREAGCNPIILIGQDLAYTDGKIHSDISHTEHEGDNTYSNHDSISSEELIYLEDYKGNPIRSNNIYKLFKEWFEYQAMAYPELEVIDATEGGAYIKGTQVMAFKEAVNKYCSSHIEKRMVEYLDDVEISRSDMIKKIEMVSENIKKELKKLKKIKRWASTHSKELTSLAKRFDKYLDEDDLYEVVVKMKAGDKVIRHILKENTVNTFYRPIISQTIIHVKQLGNDLTNENVKQNLILQLNLMKMIESSTDMILKEYENMRLFLIEKKSALKE